MMPTQRFLEVDALTYAAKYLGGRRTHTDRYASWDHCFNFFQTVHNERRLDRLASGESLHLACLQLGFYLASWGMYRGRSALLQRSLMVLEPVIVEIASMPKEIWSIDVDSYENGSVEALLECADRLRAILPTSARDRPPTDTLVTKTMLGVFGNVPAFDRFFRVGLGVNGLSSAALLRVREYFDRHSEAIESTRVRTIDPSGRETLHRYTAAKVVDMIFFTKGSEMSTSPTE